MRSGGSAALLAAAAAVILSVSALLAWPVISSGGRDSVVADGNISIGRRLSVALPDGGCRVTFSSPSASPIPPVWQASFPGSGARMSWILVEALTGIKTNNDYDSRGLGYTNVVAVKTHYPAANWRKFEELDEEFDFRKSVLVLRNPMHAIPSLYNFIYEQLNHLPNHSTRGPNEDWVKYRDSALSDQIASYENFVSYWMDRSYDKKFGRRKEHFLLVTYEQLIDGSIGPAVASRIAEFLGRTEGVDPIEEGSVGCVWRTIVQYKGQQQPDEENVPAARRGLASFADPSSLRTGPKERPYTERNLGEMLDMLMRLRERYGSDEYFVRVISSYIETVEDTVPQE